MNKQKNKTGYSIIAITIFFIVVFLYYIFIGRYSLIYQEQTRLFLFDAGFLYDFITRPGGFTDYMGIFFIQFYHIPVPGALIMTLGNFAVFCFSMKIFRKFNINSAISALVPVPGLVILQADPYFTISYTVALILSLCTIAFYSSIKNIHKRYFAGLALWLLLYAAAGGFSFLALVIFVIYELYTSRNVYSLPVIAAWLVSSIAIPYLLWLTVYEIPLQESWLSQNLNPVNITTGKGSLALLAWYPLVITLFLAGRKIPWKPSFGWNRFSLFVSLIGCLLIFLAIPGLKRLVINHQRLATIIKLDSCVQQRNWEKGISISGDFKSADPLAVFYTNICLLKTGRLSTSMFNYSQVGRNGLVLDWVEDDVTPFFGSEIFYQLGYVNEAYRWAYEAFIATGQGPRVLKRLVITSILNNDYKVAGKYADVLSKSLFYHNWAVSLRQFINDPDKSRIPEDISESANLDIRKDFFYDLDNYNSNAGNLLLNSPGNKEIFEYNLALHMLEKDLPSLVSDATMLQEYGYKEIPVHLEEALLVYMVNTDRNAVPEGFSIRESTMQRFRYYLNTSTTYVAKPTGEKAKALGKEYWNTYWYFSQFF